MKVEKLVADGSEAMTAALNLIDLKATGPKEEVEELLASTDNTELVKGLAFCLRALFETGEDNLTLDMIFDQMREETESKAEHFRGPRYTTLDLLEATTSDSLTGFTLRLYSVKDAYHVIHYMIDLFRHYTSEWTAIHPDESSKLYAQSFLNAIEITQAKKAAKRLVEAEFLEALRDGGELTARSLQLLRISFPCFGYADNRTCILTDPDSLYTEEVAELIGNNDDEAIEMIRILCVFVCLILSRYLEEDEDAVPNYLSLARDGADIGSHEEDDKEYDEEDEESGLLPSELLLATTSLLEAIAMDEVWDFYLQANAHNNTGSLLFSVIAAANSIIHFDIEENDPENLLDEVTDLINGE